MMAQVSIKDVAKKLGVSVSTVSLVLNGKGKESRVSDALAEKIQNEARARLPALTKANILN